MKLAQIIPQLKVVPLVVPDTVAQAVEDATSYRDAGFPVVEIVCRTPAAMDAIREARRALPDVFLGAGTVLSIETAEMAVEAGAQFLVSPAVDPVIMDFAKLRGLQFIPGVCTATDIAIALRHGHSLQKFFPAEASGGLGMLSALASPYGHTDLRMIAGGGVNKGNYVAYLQHSLMGAIIADWLVPLRAQALRDELAVTRKLLHAL
jgi:2-dehydro-3-deoxyphosphogluconate aldolase/(4S)-4-hydroxy-2-oxoglutarate aldolase